jgi:glycosyltransferase involved in cell wall biosynthesis
MAGNYNVDTTFKSRPKTHITSQSGKNHLRLIKVIAFPFRDSAYTDEFYTAVSGHGAVVERGDWSARWLMRNVHAGDVVHIHWPSHLYNLDDTSIISIREFAKFILLLIMIKWQKGRICWTAHNLFPHQRSSPAIVDTVARRLLIRLSFAVFVHGSGAERELVSTFPSARKKCVSIPHGNWIAKYGEPISRSQARRSLAIPDNVFVYLVFGQMKPYKNLLTLIKAFRKCCIPSQAILVLAGRFSDPQYRSAVLEAAKGADSVRVIDEFIADHDVATYLSASDAFCIPYREILTSGSAMLALGFGIPVLSICRGFLQDVVGESAGVLMASDAEPEIIEALGAIRLRDWHAEEIRNVARKFTFDEAARIFIAALSK